MPKQAGSECPECSGRLESENGLDYVCTECERAFDSADVFLL
jgi:DNA-directed RNA polymerase subunit RPC12/RpoP